MYANHGYSSKTRFLSLVLALLMLLSSTGLADTLTDLNNTELLNLV